MNPHKRLGNKNSIDPYLVIFALGLFFFYGRLFMVGFSPDASLYAGLSLKIYQTNNWWNFGIGDKVFPVFYEHPPFVFQWTAIWFHLLGASEPVARFAGATPGFMAFCLLCCFVAKEFGNKMMLLTGIMLLTFGHYTKYSATLMLEAPLSLGVVLVFIGTYSWVHHRESGPRKIALFKVFLGLMIASASKGVVALGPMMAFISILFLKTKEDWLSPTEKFVFSKIPWALSLMAVLATAAPLVIWAIASHPMHSNDIWAFQSYFIKQVYRSATTDRGSAVFEGRYHPLYYLGIFLKYGWPWWWTVPLATFAFLKNYYCKNWLNKWMPYAWNNLDSQKYKNLMICSWVFFAFFFIPFSLTKIQLPHYLHPTYLIMAPVGAALLDVWLKFRVIPQLYLANKRFFWIGGLLLFATYVLIQSGPTQTKNRGQEFYNFYPVISQVPQKCTLLVDPAQIDSYRMTAFSSWYFKNQPWAFQIKAPQAVSTAIFLRYEDNYGFSILSSSTDCRDYLKVDHIKTFRR